MSITHANAQVLEARDRFAQQMERTRPKPQLLDAAGRPRAGGNLPGANAGKVPASKGRRYEPVPLTNEDVQALLDVTDHGRELGDSELQRLARARRRAVIVFLWRSGARISEALGLTEHDLDPLEQTVFIRHGKGGKSRHVQLDAWAWHEMERWLTIRRTLPQGALFCVLSGRTAGRAMGHSSLRKELHRTADRAGLRKRCNPHTFRHTHAAGLLTEEVNILAIQRQLGHANLNVTMLYLRGISSKELLKQIRQRDAPVVRMPHAAAPSSAPATAEVAKASAR